MIDNYSYQVHIPRFDGPFDLLLFFIERDEIDIYDIPIARITNDFLAYLQQLQEHKIEVAAEFILMAARLMQIKAQMLIPRPQVNEQGEIIDPRTELIDRILEYKKIKLAVEELHKIEEEALLQLRRGYTLEEQKLLKNSVELAPQDELQGLTLVKLFTVYKKIMDRHNYEQSQPRHVIQKYPYTVENVKAEIAEMVSNTPKIDFVTLVNIRQERIWLVFCFLSILDMVQFKVLKIVVGEGYNNFWIMKNDVAATA